MKEFYKKYKKQIIIAISSLVIIVILIFTTKDIDIKLNNNTNLYETVVKLRNDNNYTIRYSKNINNEYIHIADIKIDDQIILIEVNNTDDIYLYETAFLYHEYTIENNIYVKKEVSLETYKKMFVLEQTDITTLFPSQYDVNSYYNEERTIKVLLFESNNFFYYTGDHKFEYITDTNNNLTLPSI